MTKHGHRSLERNNEFSRLHKGDEQKNVINQKELRKDVRQEEKAEDIEYGEKRHR